MSNYSKFAWILVAVLFAGTSYHHIHELSIPANHPPTVLLSQQHRIRKALNYIGNKDSGKAIVHYNRADRILKFKILFMDDIKYFTGKNGEHQKEIFERISGVHNVVIQRDTLTAVRRRDIELKEKYEQKLENQSEAESAKEQAKQAQEAQKEARKKATTATLSKPNNKQKSSSNNKHQNKHMIRKGKSKK